MYLRDFNLCLKIDFEINFKQHMSDRLCSCMYVHVHRAVMGLSGCMGPDAAHPHERKRVNRTAGTNPHTGAGCAVGSLRLLHGGAQGEQGSPLETEAVRMTDERQGETQGGGHMERRRSCPVCQRKGMKMEVQVTTGAQSRGEGEMRRGMAGKSGKLLVSHRADWVRRRGRNFPQPPSLPPFLRLPLLLHHLDRYCLFLSRHLQLLPGLQDFGLLEECLGWGRWRLVTGS